VAAPLTSVIVPVYNRSYLLRRALDSVLGQVDETTEVIVVDDGSTEDIGKALPDLKGKSIRLVRRAENGGAAAARNTGIAEARGKYLAFLDSDDEWVEGKLRRQIGCLEDDPSAALCCTGYRLIRANRPPVVRLFRNARQGAAQTAFGCGLSPGSTLVVRRDLFAAVGGFEESMPRLEDWDWLLRASERSEIAVVNDPLSIIHVLGHPGEAAVRVSTRLMHDRHAPRFRKLGFVHARRFNAALHYERAVAAFRSGGTTRAAWHYSRSLLAYPVRPFGHFRLVARMLFRGTPQPHADGVRAEAADAR